jgi:hypothetical protein
MARLSAGFREQKLERDVMLVLCAEALYGAWFFLCGV